MFLVEWVFMMVHAKNYEAAFTFVKSYAEKTLASFFPDTV